MGYSTTICKLVNIIPPLHQSDYRIPNLFNAQNIHSSHAASLQNDQSHYSRRALGQLINGSADSFYNEIWKT